ncbi:MAG: cation transporter [Olsenella sp.]|nr:cation transporter [Olsenella sp.]
MTDWLVRHFIRNADDTASPAVRDSYGTMAGIVCIVCNVLLCVAKGTIGLIAGSVSIVADAVNNLSDATSNIVSLVGFRLASKPADDNHPYGHGRIEYLAGTIVSALIIVVGLELVRSSIIKIVHPSPTEFSPAVVAILVASIAVKAWMAHFNRTLGKRIGSVTLEATAADSRNDVVSTSAVLVAAAISHATGFDLDGWVGIVVGLFIVLSGARLTQDTISPLLGNAPDPALVRRIHDTIMAAPGVLGTHDLMVHDYGPGRKFASAHVEMPAEMDPLESHEVLDAIERHFADKEHLPLVLHCDPIVTDDPALRDMQHWLSEQVKSIDARLTIHDLHAERVDDGASMRVSLDCVRPRGCTLSDDELREGIAALVAARYPNAICTVTIDSDYVSTGA